MRTKTVTVRCDYCGKQISETVTGSNHKVGRLAWEALTERATREGWKLLKIATCPDHNN